MTSIRQGRCRGSLTGGVLGSRLVAWAIGTCAQTVLRSYSLTNPWLARRRRPARP